MKPNTGHMIRDARSKISVEVESTDYAQREYGATPEQVATLEKATD